MKKHVDLVVIGGGILGAFHAYHALEKGYSVALIEEHKQPQGATVRNFGQVIPSGLNPEWQHYGRRSLEIYAHLQQQVDLSIRRHGTVYLASDDEEMQLIEELSVINKKNDYTSVLLTREQCLNAYPRLKSSYVKGGLFFPQELTVESRVMIVRLLDFLQQKKQLHYVNNTKVVRCLARSNDVEVTTASGDTYRAQKAILCSGTEFKTLFPEVFEQSDLEVVKLQILQTHPQPSDYVLKGAILTGLTIRRYEAFSACPSFAQIKQREDAHSFEKKWGIHLLFKQATDGSVLFGDSHEYADAKDADDLSFDIRAELDDFMVNEAKNIIDLPTFDIQQRWLGTYAQCKTGDIFEHTIDQHIHIVTGIGGKGMTSSAGFAEKNIAKIFHL